LYQPLFSTQVGGRNEIVTIPTCVFFGTAVAAEGSLRCQTTRVKNPSSTMLRELENTAARLARDAGDRIVATPSSAIRVRFKKSHAGTGESADPVSNVDTEVERMIRNSIAERFPNHAILGEESVTTQNDESPYVWIIDPIDGTANYLNGLPLYGCSIGVLYRHFPVAGAVWCATTHERRAGVYHACEEGQLCFDGAPIERRATPVRGVASEPGDTPRYGAFFDTRVFASASLECAFAAAGMIQLAYLSAPAIWDVAAGISLARAGGCRIVTRRDHAWTPFTSFTPLNARKRLSSLRSWRQPVLIGEPRAIDREAALGTGLQ
jgi:myo-inositol-1(or 4)-monophosphatase